MAVFLEKGLLVSVHFLSQKRGVEQTAYVQLLAIGYSNYVGSSHCQESSLLRTRPANQIGIGQSVVSLDRKAIRMTRAP